MQYNNGIFFRNQVSRFSRKIVDGQLQGPFNMTFLELGRWPKVQKDQGNLEFRISDRGNLYDIPVLGENYKTTITIPAPRIPSKRKTAT